MSSPGSERMEEIAAKHGGEWRWVVGYEGHYAISSDGLLVSLRYMHRDVPGGRIKLVTTNQWGYKTTRIWKNNKAKNVWIHRLVLEAFVGPRPDGMECAHLDGNPANNRIENLKWCTKQENLGHRKTHGTLARGSKQGSSVLTEDQVAAIKAMLKYGVPQVVIARAVSTTPSTINSINKEKSWTHV